MAKTHHLVLLLSACCFALATRAGIPVKWTTDTFKVKPLAYECYHGETLDLAAGLTAYGEPLALGGKAAKLYWQTPDMGAEWYETNATVAVDAETGATNILAATFSGAYDTGKDAVKGFIGVVGENYRAAFELKFRASPGFEPSALPLPAKVIDCAKVTFLNPTNAPWSTGGGGGGLVDDVLTNGVSAVVGKVARITIPSTNGLASVAAAQGMANAAEANAVNTATNAAVAQAMAQAENAFFPKNGGTIGETSSAHISISEAGLNAYSMNPGDCEIVLNDWSGAPVTHSLRLKANAADVYTMSQINGTSVTNLGAVVAATNAVANSDNLWNQSNTKLTTRINEVSAPIATNAAEAVVGGVMEYALTNLTGTAVTLRSGEIGNLALTSAQTSLALDLDFSTTADRSGDAMLYLVNAADTELAVGPSASVTPIGYKASDKLKAGTNLVCVTRLAYSGGKSVVNVAIKEVK